MGGCSVLDCISRSEKNSSDVSFHRFPSDESAKIKWISGTGRQNWQPPKSATICSRHFDENCFVVTSKLKTLKPRALPTMFLYKLKKNMYKRKSIKQINTEKKLILICPICDIPFTPKFVLKQHIKMIHSEFEMDEDTVNEMVQQAVDTAMGEKNKNDSANNDNQGINFSDTEPSVPLTPETKGSFFNKKQKEKPNTQTNMIYCPHCENVPFSSPVGLRCHIEAMHPASAKSVKAMVRQAVLKSKMEVNEQEENAADSNEMNLEETDVEKRECYEFVCQFCNTKFSEILEAEIHLWKVHTGKLTTSGYARQNYVKRQCVRCAATVSLSRPKHTCAQTPSKPDNTVHQITRRTQTTDDSEMISPRTQKTDSPKPEITVRQFNRQSQNTDNSQTTDSPKPEIRVRQFSRQSQNTDDSQTTDSPKPEIRVRQFSRQSQKTDGSDVMCAGCGGDFPRPGFLMHTAAAHREDRELFYFPTKKEFLSWKLEMQVGTSCSYRGGERRGPLRYESCAAAEDGGCPSMVVVEDMPTGMQVHYYKRHYGHEASTYVVPAAHRRNRLTDLVKTANGIDPDLYVQFKTLLENLVIEAAKLDRKGLVKMFNDALDMALFMSGANEEDPIDEEPVKRPIETVVGKKVINKVDEVRTSERLKRKITEVLPQVVAAKRERSVTLDTSLKKFKSDVQDEFSLPIKNYKVQNQSPSFNDQYKDFVANSCNVKNKKLGDTAIAKEVNKTDVTRKVKESPLTKGIESPVSKVKDSPVSKLKESSISNVKKSPISKMKETTVSIVKTSPMTNVKSETIIKNTRSVTKAKSPNKVKLRTKLGQFVPQKRRHSLDSSPKKVDLSKVKIAGYEVKEQKDGCNILVLKI